MNNQEIRAIAMKQSAFDLNCTAEDFTRGNPKVVLSASSEQARKYLELPFFCNLVSYGFNTVASVDPRIAEFIQGFLENRLAYRCFETPAIHLLTEEFSKYGKVICYMAEYFLPDVSKLSQHPCPYPVKLLEPEEFADFYKEEWSNALCEKRKQLDRLAAGAYDGGRLIGLAGCSADCEEMWQIGIDVLPDYRKRGVAAALTSRLALEVVNRGKVPFYCAAWSNIPSVRNAIACGFRPAWTELTAIDAEKARIYL